MINRRLFIAGTTALAGCQPPSAGTATAPVTPPQSQLQEYAGLVAAGAKSVTDSILATPGLAADKAAQITKDAAEVETANNAIQGLTDVQPNASTLVTAIQDLGPVLLALLPGGSAAWMAANAALALAPTIAKLAGLAPITAAVAPKKAVGMNESEAVLVLRGYTK